MADKNFGAIRTPGPRPWWHLPAIVVGGLAVVGIGVYGWHRIASPAHLSRKTVAAVQRVHRKPSSAPQSGSAVPDYVRPAQAGTSIFTQMAAINTHYIAWADQRISQAVPAIPSSGPGAGTLTPAILNAPLTLKEWPGPRVPTSLQAAGVTLPVGTPANGSIVGLTPALVAESLHYTQKMWPTLTASELMGAYQTAAEYVMAAEGNNPMSGLQYDDPYTNNGQEDQSFIQQSAESSPAGPFTAGGGVGMIPARQVDYESWISYSINPTDYWASGTTLAGGQNSAVATKAPAGHVLVSGVVIQGLTDHIIGTDMIAGHLMIGQFPIQVGDVTLALVQNGAQTHWYVTAAHEFSGGNTPSATYWTAPS
uniref:Uncharacterized protein n=1 Tax=Sulfobacillus thermotolerans TaxID=338644 RepID=G5CIZ2_9FIRM|nr:hypothetical protein [Sulfobacillus thermotolerans]AEP14269.1 hypothetical protein [Sulfobacillus thermotolerans]